MSSPSTSASVNYKRQTEEQRLALQDAQYGFVESRREQVRHQEELSMKEEYSEILKSEICTKWEKLRELKNDG